MWEYKNPVAYRDLCGILENMRCEMSEAQVIGLVTDILCRPDFGVRECE